MRARKYFSLIDLILQYKSQILSYLEYRTAAISHAADTHLCVVDSVQKRFLDNVNLVPQTALLNFNLAPLSCRRDIANLGVIYRAVIRRGPKILFGSSLRWTMVPDVRHRALAFTGTRFVTGTESCTVTTSIGARSGTLVFSIYCLIVFLSVMALNCLFLCRIFNII